MDGAMSRRRCCKPSSYGMRGHGSRQRNAKTCSCRNCPGSFCADICILQGAGEAPRAGDPGALSWGEGSFPAPAGEHQSGTGINCCFFPLCLDQKSPESKGVIIVAIIVCILVVAVLGSVIYFLHKKGKIPCGRAGKQDM